MLRPLTLISVALIPAFAAAAPKTTEQDMNFAACRANMQALYMAHTGGLTRFTVNTDSKLESKFLSKDGSTDITITCLAAENKMIIEEAPAG